MTYLDIVFRYSAIPGENEMRAIDAMREVYGIRRVQFNEKEGTVRVEFDASRLKQDGVARLLRNAGVDIGEPLLLTLSLPKHGFTQRKRRRLTAAGTGDPSGAGSFVPEIAHPRLPGRG